MLLPRACQTKEKSNFGITYPFVKHVGLVILYHLWILNIPGLSFGFLPPNLPVCASSCQLTEQQPWDAWMAEERLTYLAL